MLADALANLPGDVSLQVSDHHAFHDGPPVVLVEQDLGPGVRYATWLPVTQEVLDDAVEVRGYVQRSVDRWLRPWLFPDPNPFPAVDLFPRWNRSCAHLAQVWWTLTRPGRAWWWRQ